MSMNVFVTGDRSMPAEIAIGVAAHVIAELATLAALNDDRLNIGTGINNGVEEGVRSVASALDFGVAQVDQRTDPETGKPDWDARHLLVAEAYDRVVVVHPDVLDSRIGSSCIRIVPDEKLTLVGG